MILGFNCLTSPRIPIQHLATCVNDEVIRNAILLIGQYGVQVAYKPDLLLQDTTETVLEFLEKNKNKNSFAGYFVKAITAEKSRKKSQISS